MITRRKLFGTIAAIATGAVAAFRAERTMITPVSLAPWWSVSSGDGFGEVAEVSIGDPLDQFGERWFWIRMEARGVQEDHRAIRFNGKAV
jgi:hypothetical protein